MSQNLNKIKLVFIEWKSWKMKVNFLKNGGEL